MDVLVFQVCLWTVILQTGVYAANQRPRFINDMNGLTLKEDTPVGTSVYKLTARDDDGDPIIFGIEADMFEVRDPRSGDVYLTRKLDYESLVQPFKVKVWVKDEELRETREPAITVLDVNDELPQFERSTYQVSIPETTAVGTTVLRNIQVTDDDSVNPRLIVTCIPPENPQAVNPCLVFGLSQQESSHSKWRGDLVLFRRLNHETQSSYNVFIRAFDGEHNITMMIRVDVQDVQDKPPRFTNTPRATISENVPLGTSVLQMTAVDGDAGSPRKIVYELVSNPGDLFRIDRQTGQITTNRQIDRESELLSSSIVSLTVKASELVSGSTAGTDRTTFSVTRVNITVQDENDNSPEFNRDNYQVTIPEDVQDRTPLSTPIIEVTDHDQGDNAAFELILENYNDMFGILPTEGSETLTANIYVKNSSLIDYDTEPRKYVLHLIARETKTPEKRSNDAYVTIDLTDVNDNKPVFAQTSYEADVSETATHDTPVILITATDRDSGMFGPAFLYYKLIGNGAEFFNVNQLTGQVTVAAPPGCVQPGVRNCLDYETQKEFRLTFVVGDQSGEGYIVNVPLTIHVLDENDNSPKLGLPTYFRYIKEGETTPTPHLQVQATDADSPRNGNNVITYSIVGGNVGDLWQINPRSGVITARSPIDYEATPGKRGYYLLTVQAADPTHQVTAEVNITVIDVNDHPPVFTQNGRYEQTISEETPPGTVVETVRATDADAPSSLNGQVKFRIITGAQDKFSLHPKTGVITVAPDATFDYDVKNLYEMTVLATDQGSPQKTATATVLVHIRDSNNKNPYFFPTTVTTDVYENATIGQVVKRMQATDPDSSASLVYYLEEPKQAWDTHGQEVAPSSYDFRNLFNIERITGIVRVNHTLNRDKVAVVSSTVKTVDTSGHGQSATATLIINILEVNDKAPEFRTPWTVAHPVIPLTVKEGKPKGSHVTTLVATDPNDAIDQYKIISDPGGFFTINNITGVVKVKRPLDYETSQTAVFVVTATDNGHPQLTSTATVNIAVENINDETPRFQKPFYRVRLMENSPGGSYVPVDISATDADLGDYGVIRYSLEDPQNRFTIDPISGTIRVAAGAVLDREKQVETQPVITITVGARDSPNHPDESKYSSVPVLITLEDANDNTPRFGSQDYYDVVAPTAPVHTRCVQLTADDADIGENARLVFYKISGDPGGLFEVDATTGAVTVAAPLGQHPGIYNITVGVRDSGSPKQLNTTAMVHITVLEGNNAAPTWLFPNATYGTVRVLENMYLGLEVTQVTAVDKDDGDNGRVSYSFSYNDKYVSQTPEFSINAITGVITARRVFDREETDTYILELVAHDAGYPPFRSTEYLTVNIIDVDDHDPQFPQYQNCCAIPYHMSIYVDEKKPTGQILGQVKATDEDLGKHALTTYTIVGGDPKGTFKVNSTTGVLSVNKPLNYEIQRVYRLSIRASNLERTAEVSIPAHCLCNDPSLVIVIVNVLINGTDPAFTYRQYNACIAIDAPLSSLVTVVEARDPYSKRGMNYSMTTLRSVNTEDPGAEVPANTSTFLIGPANGSVYSNALMTRYKAHYFQTTVTATGLTGHSTAASLRIWVTLSSQRVTLTFERPIDEVKRDMEQIIRLISDMTDGGIVCVGDPRYHITEANIVNVDWTDLVVYVIDGTTHQVMPGAALVPILKATPGTVAASLSYSEWGGFVISPLLAAIIAVLLLLLLLLLLLCCCCFCCAGWYRRDVYTQRIPLIANVAKMNPLYYLKQKFYENQELSMNIGDKADLEMTNLAFAGEDQTDGWKRAAGVDQLANGGANQTNMTVTQTSSHYQVTSQQGALSNGNAMSAGDVPRIEADLLGSSVAQREERISHTQTNVYVDRTQGGSYEATFGGRRPTTSLSTVATMTDDDIGVTRGGGGGGGRRAAPAPFGAILTRSEGNLAQRMYSSSSELDGPGFGGPRVVHTAPLHQGVQVYNVTQTYGDVSPQGYEHSGWGDGASYQGEIHVGSLAMPRPPPPAYQVQENVFTETYRY